MPRGDRSRCLIVDDSPVFLRAAASMLQRDGFEELRTASTIAEALGCMEEFRPDVTLVDVYLGEENGFELVELLDRAGWCSRSAVILVSTHAAQELADAIAASPAAGFLSKIALSSRAIHDLMSARDNSASIN